MTVAAAEQIDKERDRDMARLLLEIFGQRIGPSEIATLRERFGDGLVEAAIVLEYLSPVYGQ